MPETTHADPPAQHTVSRRRFIAAAATTGAAATVLGHAPAQARTRVPRTVTAPAEDALPRATRSYLAGQRRAGRAPAISSGHASP